MTPHPPLYDRKQDAADDIRDWVRVLLHEPTAELETLERLSLSDLTSLSIAIDKAGASWMSALVHHVMSDKGEA